MMTLEMTFIRFLVLVLASTALVCKGCVDTSLYCGTWKNLGRCNNTAGSAYFLYMKANCAASCNLCNGTTTQAPLITPGPIDPTKCGIKGTGHTRIVGGTNARPGDWPWQVAIKYKSHNGNWCGGTLLNEEWVLSAAHCFENDLSPKNYSIVLGEHDVKQYSPIEARYEIAQIIMHPHYDTNTIDNDMALLKLKNNATLNTRIRPACLPNVTTKFTPGDECYVTGWGTLKYMGTYPGILQQAKVPLISSSECQRSMGSFGLTKSMFCAGYLNRTIDSCSGDSGGPLVCKRNTSTGQDVWYLWGVVSWGDGCAKPGTYGVYASVHELGQWISNITSV